MSDFILSRKGSAGFVRRGLRLAAVTGAGACVLLIGLLVLLMPGVALEASLKGLSVWWEVLFPALFPFFVLSEVLLGFGIVHLAAALLDPLMRPLFRIPGAGGFVLALSFGAGYPIGARLTSRLMEQNLLSRGEGERLVAMTTTSDPIFLIGAVCLGFFGRLDIVPVLAAAHYGGAMLLGLLLRWRKDEPEPEERSRQAPDNPALRDETGLRASRLGIGRVKQAILAMHEARMADGRPFGIVLNQAVKSSLALMIVVGGLVVCFSATLQLLLHSGLLLPLKHAIVLVLQTVGLEPGLAGAFVQGAFEVTLGNAASAAGAGPGGIPAALIDRVAVASFVLAWAGLSVHAQVAGLMGRTGWRYGPFARARLLHAGISVALVYLLWPWLYAA
ncbi:sporulation integral membrane protein YlbJ [Cohnella ginsengisoli]|uniref:Sporulation integral membrane protein YlbJ n=1 Tax=Cohnella ginsengisoli TaxID=425004 RepID=A0A9X4KEV3_9BACL|nr:nucleoside recognition domain-containing protein [Cohnella ginsengisoli]MDG0790723.1 sporulation integral membrane protein YlbJ [Cohnella ginsengisoli]